MSATSGIRENLLSKMAWSASARLAALEARRRKRGTPTREYGAESDILREMKDGGWENPSAETLTALARFESERKVYAKDLLGCTGPIASRMQNPTKKVEAAFYGNGLNVNVNLTSDSGEAAHWERVIIDKKVLMMNFTLSKELQGMGVGREVFRKQLDVFDSMGIEELSVTAGLDRGGYAWARHGYLPKPTQVWDLGISIRKRVDNLKSILRPEEYTGLMKLADALPNHPEALWGVSDSRYGNQILSGTVWGGYLDLKKSSTQRTRLENYIGYKRKV